jgi:hypothetical protein
LFTVTVNEHCDEMPDASLTELLTVVVPIGNFDEGTGDELTTPTPGQLSVAATVNGTTAVAYPRSATVVILGGQAMTGGVLSITVTVNEHEVELPGASFAV